VTIYWFRHERAQNLWRFSKSVAINKFRIIVIAQGEKTKLQKEKRKKASQGEKTKIQKEKSLCLYVNYWWFFFLNFSKIMIFQLMTFVCRLITIFWDDFEMNKEKKIVVKWAWIRQQKHSELSPPLSWSHWWADCCPARPIYQQLSKFSKNPS